MELVMKTKLIWTWIVCAGLAGCSGARTATNEEQLMALNAVATGRGVRDLGSSSKVFETAMPAMPGTIDKRSATGLKTEDSTIQLPSGVVCNLSDETVVNDEHRRLGTCNNGQLAVDLR